MKRLLLPLSEIFCCSLVLVGLLLTVNHYVEATDGASLWGPQADNPTVKMVEENHTASQEERYRCHDHDFVLRVARDDPYTGYYFDRTYTQCAFYTAFGLVGTGDIMQLNNSIQPYYLSDPASILPIPNERSLFLGNGMLSAIDDPLTAFGVGAGADLVSQYTEYKNMYRLRSGIQTRVLKDSMGNEISQLRGIKASSNARWFITQRGRQFLRVKADNFDVLAFPGDYDYWGDPKSDDMAITGDGRYVVVVGTNRPNFKLYDLSTCQADTSYNLNDATGCGSIDMLNYLQQQVKLPIVQVNFPHFSDDGTQLSLNVVVNDNGTKRNELVVLIAPGASYNPATQASNYIALGDSYASGEGAFNYFGGTDEGDNKCHLSKASYPYLLELQLHLDSVHSVACSGAKIINVNGAGPPASQYTTRPLDAFSDYWMPGYSPQINFIDNKQPNIVTISMVGNDIGFGGIIEKCTMLPETCYSDYQDRKGLVLNIDSVFDSLVAMYVQIKADAAPDARVYAIGYPQIVQRDGNCAVNVRLDQEETEFAGDLVDYLDSVIEQATAKAGIGYVNTEQVFEGHNLCGADPTAVNGLTAGNDKIHIFGNESYHPTPVGYQLLADAIAAQTDDFQKPNPTPDWSIKAPDPGDAVDFLGTPGNDQQPATKIEFDQSASQEPVLRGGEVQSTLPASDFHLDPGAAYHIVLHSTQIDLGSTIADAEGNLSYTLTIPTTIDPGWHTIDVYGNDVTGQAIDIQRIIYVATSASDWDGDGVPNDQEPCGLIPASGVDADKDGIDDACDGVISKPPVPAAPTVSITNPINAANQQQVAVSGSGEEGTTAHISVDDTDPDTKAITAEATLSVSDASTVNYTQSLDVSSLDDGKLTVSVTLSNDCGTSPATTADVVKDTRPPTISITQDPVANEAGWNNQFVKLQLEASDTGTGVADLTYSAAGAQPIDTQSTESGSASFTVSTEGETVVTYTATDKAGNRTTQTATISIDTEPPATSVNSPQSQVLFGIFGNVLTGSTTDNFSGTATTEVTFVSKARKTATTLQATCMSGCGTVKTTWQVDTTHLPSGQYTVTASSVDQAGNDGPVTPPLRIVMVNPPQFWVE